MFKPQSNEPKAADPQNQGKPQTAPAGDDGCLSDDELDQIAGGVIAAGGAN